MAGRCRGAAVGSLERGRERLRARLVRRGVAPSAAMLASVMAAESAYAVPVELMGVTLGAASRIAAGLEIPPGESSGPPVYFTPFDDGTVVTISVKIREGETPAKAFKRIEAFVAEAIAPKLGDGEVAGLKQQEFGTIFDLVDVPDAVLDPYGVAFSLARRDQLGLDPARLGRALEAVTDEDLRRVARTVFDPGRHAGAIAGAGKGDP